MPKQTKYLSSDDVIALMRQRQGVKKQNDFAREMNVSPQYLCDILKLKRNPGPEVLKFLGLEKIVVYRSIRNTKGVL